MVLEMKLKSLFELDKGSIVSIVGAGGKTTLMFSLAEELRKNYKVLVTTTTKIYKPQKNQYDYIALDTLCLSNFKDENNTGVYLYGNGFNDEGKLLGVSCDMLNMQASYFDYVLVEADGSRGKSIKGWKEDEPVICCNTHKTIGVLDIQSLEKVINNDNVHRLMEFKEITNSQEGELIREEHIISLVFHPNGLFKNAKGERILFINKVEREVDFKNTKILLNNINRKNSGYIHKIVYGNLKNMHLYNY